MAIDLSEREAQIDVMLAEAQVRLDAMSARTESVSSRAGILVASAAITVSLWEMGAPAESVLASALFGMLSAGLGVFALFPAQTNYTELIPLRAQVISSTTAEAKLLLVDDKINFYNNAAKRLAQRAWAVRWGYVSLAVSIATAVFGMIGRG